MIKNGLLTVLQEKNNSTTRTASYFVFLLWLTAGLSMVRFLGCAYFLGRASIMCCFTKR